MRLLAGAMLPAAVDPSAIMPGKITETICGVEAVVIAPGFANACGTPPGPVSWLPTTCVELVPATAAYVPLTLLGDIPVTWN